MMMGTIARFLSGASNLVIQTDINPNLKVGFLGHERNVQLYWWMEGVSSSMVCFKYGRYTGLLSPVIVPEPLLS